MDDPLKTTMLIFLLALEIPAIIILAVGWVKACKEAERRNHDFGERKSNV